MSTTISTGSLTTSPDLVKNWASFQETRNVIHTVIGKSAPDVTLKPAAMKSGKLSLFYTSLDAAESARTLFTTAAVFTIYTTDAPWINGFNFVVNGSVSAIVEEIDLASWHLDIDYQEVQT